MPRIRLFIAWYDMWVGLYFDRKYSIYICLIPCVVLQISHNCDWCHKAIPVASLDGDDLCLPCANKWVKGEGIAAQEYDKWRGEDPF